MLFVATAVLLIATVSADPFIYNVYSSSGSASPFGSNPYTRDEVYIRRPSIGGGSPYYSGMGNQMMMIGGGAGGLQGLQGLQGYQSLQGLQGLQGMQTLQSMQGMPFGSSSNMMGSYGSSNMYKPRFAASEMMTGQPLVLNGYPMYPKSSGYPMVIPLGMGSFGSSPAVFQGPTVSRLPFQATQRARFFL